MGHGSYIGRIGALAVALGVGTAVTAPTGVAWAAPDDSNPASSSAADTGGADTSAGSTPPAPSSSDTISDSASDASAGPDGSGEADEASVSHNAQLPARQPDQSPTSSTVKVAPGVTISSSGGAHTSGQADGDDTGSTAKKPVNPRSKTRSLVGKKSAAQAASTTAQANTAQAAEDNRETGKAITPAATAAATADVTPVATAAATADVTPMTLAAAQPAVAKAATSPVTFLLQDLVQPMLSAFLGALPKLPTESPLGWLLLAAARRQMGVTEPETTVPTTAAVTTGLVENQLPTVGATFDTPVAVTGVVTGQVVATDPEGTALTYTLTTPPAAGKVVFDKAAAKFTYTPTAAQRISAAMTPGDDTIAMTITVSDGTNSVPTTVDIPVSAAPITMLAEIAAVNDSHAVVATATRAYVANRAAGTVTVIDTTNNSVIGTIAVGPTPDSLAIKPDGTRLYVTSLDNNTVKVVDTGTRAVIKTITVAKPSAITINSSGSTLYVASLDTGKVYKIATSTKTISGSITLPAGSRPTGIVVSPDKTKIYVISEKATGGGTVAVFGYTSSTVTTITNIPTAPTDLAVSPDNRRLYVGSADGNITVVDTNTRAVVVTHTVDGVPAGVTVSKDGSMLLVTDAAGRVAALNAVTGAELSTFATRSTPLAMTVAPSAATSPDGTQLYVTDADAVYVVSLIPLNNAPTVGAPTIGTPNAAKGTITGAVRATDIDRDALKYTLTGKPAKGTISFKADGTFTYTPTSTARHAASAGKAAVTTDSFNVSVSDGRGGVTTTVVTVDILPANKVPTYQLTVGTPNSTTGVVTGKVTASDGDFDKRTFTVSTPAKGTVVVTSGGTFTYTPTAGARHAAAQVGATIADKQDTFTVTIDDGHGGVVPVAVTVALSPANSAPTGAKVGDMSIDVHTGVVTGTIAATDANNDPLSFTSTAPTKGVLVFGSDGTFTYTPTEAARRAAATPGATTATKTDAVTVIVSDGYGGSATVALKLTVTPWGNTVPTNGHATAGDPNEAIGEVRGTLVADDAEHDALTYVLATGPSKGVVKIDASGTFRYVPNVEARWGAATTPGTDSDSFTVTAGDGNGGSTTFTVRVPVAPPSTSSSAIDQRGTTVAMNVQELYFASQADTNRALDLLKADGVDTIRVMIPWAGVEATDDVWTWSAVDRVVSSAVAREMKVQAFLNSSPGWAVVPGTPALGGPPADLQEYAEFVGTVAARYTGQVSAYEVWNEPNYHIFWEPTPDAAQYTALLKVAYTAIKAADPNAVVVGGVIAAAPDSGTKAVNSVRFVKEMYEAGAAGYFDALSYHPYHYYVKFSQGGPYPTSPLTMANQIHDVMVANGDGNKKIWATEYGEPSKLGSETIQAAYLSDFLRAWRDLDYAGPAFIHTVRDYVTLDPAAASFGVYRLDWSPKPAVGVIETVIDENEAYLGGGGGIEL